MKQNTTNKRSVKVIERPTIDEVICEHCDGCGLIANKLCAACNGHGYLAYDFAGNHRYSRTIEQSMAIEKLGGTA